MTGRPPGLLRRSDDADVRLMIGTAGHVDHGKTRLVRILTGCETDRLKIEKERGMSIELGFAPCRIGADVAAGIVDVPGHEQFIKNMTAGAAGMDMAVLVVAADDGVMPQTIEHLQIMEFMGVRHGMVALTKIDLVGPERVEEACGEVRALCAGTFLEGAPICPLSSETYEGLDGFYDTLVLTASRVKKVRQQGVFRMPVERVFSVAGHGTVATGIPTAGRIAEGDEVEILPGGTVGRVRGIQRFLREASEGRAGQCLALNIAGIDRESVDRGFVVAKPGYVRACSILQVVVTACDNLASPIVDGEEVRVHTGTVEAQGKIALYGTDTLDSGGRGFATIRLAAPIAASPTDRFVVRRNSPTITIGGGVILRVLDRRPKGSREVVVKELETQWAAFSTPESRFEYHFAAAQGAGSTVREAATATLIDMETAGKFVEELVREGKLIPCSEETYLHKNGREDARERVVGFLKKFHSEQPTEYGPTQRDLSIGLNVSKAIVDLILKDLIESSTIESSNNRISLTGREGSLSAREVELVKRIEAIYSENGYSTPRPDELPEILKAGEAEVLPLLDYLCGRGTLIRLGKKVVFHRQWIKEAEELVVREIQTRGELDSADFKDLIHSSRKYALAILDYFDTIHVTQRFGNNRRLHQAYLRKRREG